jgi:sugar phosphate isomerase/epimerase
MGYARDLGLKYVVCPLIPKAQQTSLDGYRKAADLFNEMGSTARGSGMEFVYHNQSYEFRPMEGSDGWTELMKHTDPALVKLELDLYWLLEGGQDPAALMRRHKDRTVLLHLKDRTAGPPVSLGPGKAVGRFAEMGKGTMDWTALLRQGREQGIRYALMDQDETPGPVVDSLRASYAYLQSLKV